MAPAGQSLRGDDLLSPITRRRGLPIGNLTSQFWANVYLDPLDQFVKRQQKCAAYLRYVDDLLLFGRDKATLHAWRAEVIDFAAGLRLTFHEERAQVFLQQFVRILERSQYPSPVIVIQPAHNCLSAKNLRLPHPPLNA